MADDRYLDGDPAAPVDLGDFVTLTAQELALIADLIEVGRTADARCHALTHLRRAKGYLHTLEKEPLPECDVDATPDTLLRSRWVYKTSRPTR